MRLSYSVGAYGTIYIFDETEHILHVIENKEELKELVGILTELLNELQ